MSAPVLDLRSVSRRFSGPPPVEALRSVDLVVHPGDYLSIVGSSGSGKSTLMNILGLLDRPTTGTFLLDGVVTSEMSERARCYLRGTRIGFVFQAFHLLPRRTVLENVGAGLLYRGTRVQERRERAAEAMERAGIAHQAGALPVNLSGGERQRVAIARAIVGRPSIVLADEPTGNLDSENTALVMDLFDQLHRAGQTIVVITHDPEVSARSRRTVTMRDGVLTEAIDVNSRPPTCRIHAQAER